MKAAPPPLPHVYRKQAGKQLPSTCIEAPHAYYPASATGFHSGETMQELIAIQQNGPKELGFFGTRNMGFLHQNLIEILSYAMVLTVSPQ